MRICKSSLGGLLTLAALGFVWWDAAPLSAGRPQAGAGALFVDATASAVQAGRAVPAAGAVPADRAIQVGRAVMRSRAVTINFAALTDRTAPGVQAGARPTLVLNLFDDASFAAVLDRVDAADAGFTWVGHIPGVDMSTVTLATVNGTMAGSIVMPGSVYAIEYVGDGLHNVQQIDQSEFPPELEPVDPIAAGGAITAPRALDAPIVAGDSGSQLDVMVLYTDAAAAAAGGAAAMAARINLGISESNTSYANSGITQRLRLIYSQQMTYTENSDLAQDLYALSNRGNGGTVLSTPLGNSAASLRDAYGADLVMLVTAPSSPNGCGISWLMATISSGFAPYGFSVVERSCISPNYTFAHELGHNMGARHDWYIDNGTTPHTYAHGYIYTPSRWRTVMAYNNLCPALLGAGNNCTRLLYWANPGVSYGGVPMGIPGGTKSDCPEGDTTNTACDADDSRTLNATAYTVANFRQEAVPAPPVVTTNPANQAVSAGSTAKLTAAASGFLPPTIQWQTSAAGTTTWSNLSEASPYSGVKSTTLTVTAVSVTVDGSKYRAVFTNTLGVATTAAAVLRVTQLTASPSTLVFGATKAGAAATTLSAVTPAQTVRINVAGNPTSWTAMVTQTWVQLTGGSGSGPGELVAAIVNPGNVLGGSTRVTALIIITPGTAGLSTIAVPVTLNIDQTGGAATSPPVGLVDTPVQNATGQVGAIGVTGWVVDDVGVSSVKLYRNCLAFEPSSDCAIVNGVNLVYIGDATIVTGARPDIEAAYPTYPQNNRAGWGYLLLTNMLPHVPNQLMFGGQGTLTLYVLAQDLDGHQRWLGRGFITAPSLTNETPTTFTMANDTIAKPFGAIDTPTQGQTVSGSFWNFGWTLTPDSNTTADAGDILMPLTGATQWVYIDGVAVAPLGAYNLCRGHVDGAVPPGVYCDDDVASIFGNPTPQPTYTPRTTNPTKHRNLDAGRGPIGAYWLDTTTLGNGIHTIVWGVTDSAGRGEGIGSRYFTVLNGTADAVAPRGAPAVAPEVALRDAPAQPRGEASVLDVLTPATGRVWGRTGYDVNAPYADVTADEAGVRQLQIPDFGRLELWLDAAERGYLVANGTLRDLPPGSHLDPQTGQFTWAPGLGYLGTYRLAFVRGGELTTVDVTIRPMPPTAPGEQAVRMFIDVPREGDIVSGAITIAGWALDPSAWTGSGIDAVHVWAQRVDEAAATPQFLGAAALGGQRPDVAAVYGASFGTAGFSLTTNALPAGEYDITIFVWNRRTARWEDARTVRFSRR